MAAAPFTLEQVESNAFGEGQRLGWFKGELRDVVWTSDGSNETADATIEPADVGLQRIVGVLFFGESAITGLDDAVGQLKVSVQTDGTVDLSALSSAGAALDLDSTDTAAARVLILGY